MPQGQPPRLRAPPAPPDEEGLNGDIKDDAQEEGRSDDAELGDRLQVIIVGVPELHLEEVPFS